MYYTLEEAKREIEIFHNAIADLEQSYNCDWNDTVHESYGTYVRACKTMAYEIEQTMRNLEASCSRLRNIEPDRLIQESAEICKKIENFRI